MNAHRQEAIITEDRTLHLRNLPFGEGQSVKVIVLANDDNQKVPETDAKVSVPPSEWEQASLSSLREVWDNADDATYDNV